jgi:hypothetical protein
MRASNGKTRTTFLKRKSVRQMKCVRQMKLRASNEKACVKWKNPHWFLRENKGLQNVLGK